jgi:molecular chaperone GrpE
MAEEEKKPAAETEKNPEAEKKDAPQPEVKEAGQDENKKKEESLNQQISILQAEAQKAKDEAQQWKNKFYLAYADLANTRKQIEKDHEISMRYRSQGFIEKMLPALDSFEMAMSIEPKDPALKNYYTGFKMILSQLESALSDEGVSLIVPKPGDKFDANTMHAVQTVDGKEDGLIGSVYLKGYMLKDRLIRPAMVIVTKKPEEKKAEAKPEAEPDKKDEKSK